MALLKQWRDAAYSETTNKGDLQRMWQKYFDDEKNIYAELLQKPDEVVPGTVKELADKFGVTILTMTGFLDGINDSLKEANPIEEMEEDTVVNLGFDKADNVVVLSKDSDGNWTENMIVANEDGCVVITIEEGKQLLLNLSGAEVPDLDNPETDGESGIVYMVCVAALLLAVVVNSKRKGAKR